MPPSTVKDPSGFFDTLPRNIARVQNCPDVKVLNSLFGLCLLSFCLLVFLVFSSFRLFFFLSQHRFVRLSFCHDVFLFFDLDVFLSFCLLAFWSFCHFVFLSSCIFIFLSRHHYDQMSEGSEVSKVTLCVKF